MVLFHGTNEKSGEAIIKDGMLRCNCKRKYTTTEFQAPNGDTIDLSTTNGFVYLANWLPRAVRFGYTSCWDEHNVCSGKIYVFCINVPESTLQADLDELRMRYSGYSISKSDYKQSLEICQCVRLKDDLPLGRNSKLLVVPATNEGGASEYAAVCNSTWHFGTNVKQPIMLLHFYLLTQTFSISTASPLYNIFSISERDGEYSLPTDET